ncbi:MAG: calcium-binding protein, partial [Novosphingobium sp.]
DTLLGSAGADHLDGGSGFDTVDYSASASAVTVNLDGSVSSGGDASGDTLSDVERVIGSLLGDILRGSDGADTLEGNDGADAIYGGAGDDTLLGQAGNDTLIGGTGADALDGGSGADTVDYSASATGVNVGLDGAANSGGDAEADTRTNIVNVVGSAVYDGVRGGTGAGSRSGARSRAGS